MTKFECDVSASVVNAGLMNVQMVINKFRF